MNLNFKGISCNDPSLKDLYPPSPCRSGDPCSVSRAELEAQANAKVDNRIFFMGITKYGYQQPIREAVNPSFRDKFQGRPSLQEFLPDPKAKEVDYGRLAENFHSIDIYSGLVDGMNYGRFERLYHHKRRHARNPNGTEKRYCIPIANNMNYGWFLRDKAHLDETKWYAARERFPQVRGEITKFVDDMALHSPNFILF